MLEEQARANGLTLSEWVRDVLLSASAEPGAEAGEVVLAELLALRSLFLNLQFRADKGPLTEAEMRGLIERADGVKMQRASGRKGARCKRGTRPVACSQEMQREHWRTTPISQFFSQHLMCDSVPGCISADDLSIKFASKLKAQAGVLALFPFSSLFRICKLQILKGRRDSDPVSGHHLESIA